MKLYTIGFTKTTAEQFFTRLRSAGVQRVLDVRLNNVSQLAGFAKRDDLRFFVNELCAAEYVHEPRLAPTQPLLDSYKKRGGDWDAYAEQFVSLMESRRIEEVLPRPLFDQACLLCSEDKPHHCHRRLVAEYLAKRWRDVEIVHL